jgi:hypothetical protein
MNELIQILVAGTGIPLLLGAALLLVRVLYHAAKSQPARLPVTLPVTSDPQPDTRHS